MTMTRNNNYKDYGFILSTIDELVPEDHLVRKIESAYSCDNSIKCSFISNWMFVCFLCKHIINRRNYRTFASVF